VEENKIDAKNRVRNEDRKPVTQKKKKKVPSVNSTLVQTVSELQEVCVNNTATVLPTIVTSLPTSIPLLVQAANGQVEIL
jgi:hypothetical protein